MGLLFLTPLKAREVVLAKGLVHGVRALTLWLAVLPVMTITFLIGGVTWKEATMSVLMNFSSICWALAAGLLASSVTKTWLRAMVLAFALAFLLCGGVFCDIHGNGDFFKLRFGHGICSSVPKKTWDGRGTIRNIYLLNYRGDGIFWGVGRGSWMVGSNMFGGLSRSSLTNAWMLTG